MGELLNIYQYSNKFITFCTTELFVTCCANLRCQENDGKELKNMPKSHCLQISIVYNIDELLSKFIILLKLIEMIGVFPEPTISPTNYNIFQIINFSAYESLPRWMKEDPDPMLLTNLNRYVSQIAWHSRFRTIYPHSLKYVALRSITLDDVQQLLVVLKNPKFNINDPIDQKYQLTALQYATIKNKFPIIQLLLMYGADINKSDAQGNTPLMMAVSNQCLQSINSLMKNGCDRDKANVYEITPKKKALEEQAQYIAQFIQKFPKTPRKFPKFRIKLDIQKQINSPISNFLRNYKIYSSKISKNPFNNFKGDYKIILNNFKVIPDIIKQTQQ